MLETFHMRFISVLLAMSLGLSACGGGSSSTPPTAPPTNTVGGAVTGLTSGQSVTLLDNGGGTLAVTSNSSFTFATGLAAGASYAVTVGVQPTGQSCSVTNGTGKMAGSAVTNVAVSCLNKGESVVHAFTGGADGSYPFAGLVLDATGNLYGTTYSGGTGNVGTVFKIVP